MEGHSFHVIEERIGPAIRGLADETLMDKLKEEFRITMAADPARHGEHVFDEWAQHQLPGLSGLTVHQA